MFNKNGSFQSPSLADKSVGYLGKSLLSSITALMLAAGLFLPAFSPAFSAIKNEALCHSGISGVRQDKLGRLGIGVLEMESGTRYFCRPTEHFPMQSVFKLLVALAVLERVDDGLFTLEKTITVKKDDLSILYSPLAEHFSGDSHDFTIRELINTMVQDSDNTACDVLMRYVGGPKQVNASLKRHGVDEISVDRYEAELQPEILGLPPMKLGHAADKARWERDKHAATGPRAHKAFSAYINGDLKDSSTPQGMLNLLQKLYNGNLLTATSTKYLIDTMAGAQTGQRRLRAGLPEGAILAHKTGTGPDLDGVNSATNDVGIIALPSGHHIAIVVFLSGSTLPEDEREGVIARVCNYIVTHTQ
jgi:beta-lactamase class A